MPSHTPSERIKEAVRRRLQAILARLGRLPVGPGKPRQGLRLPTYRDIQADPELKKYLEGD